MEDNRHRIPHVGASQAIPGPTSDYPGGSYAGAIDSWAGPKVLFGSLPCVGIPRQVACPAILCLREALCLSESACASRKDLPTYISQNLF